MLDPVTGEDYEAETIEELRARLAELERIVGVLVLNAPAQVKRAVREARRG